MMKINKTIMSMTVALFAMVGLAGDSAPFLLDTVTTSTSPLVDSLSVSWDASWIGGDANATVVIADNGAEIGRKTGVGEVEYVFDGTCRHNLTYTALIGGVEQAEVYTVTVFKDWKYVVADGAATITGIAQKSSTLVIPSEIDGYPVTVIGDGAFYGCSGLTRITMSGNCPTIEGNAFSGVSESCVVRLPAGNATYDVVDGKWQGMTVVYYDGAQEYPPPAAPRVGTHYEVVYGTVGQPLVNPDTGMSFVDIDFCDIDNFGGDDLPGDETITTIGFPSWLVWDKTAEERRSPNETAWWYDGGNYHPISGTPTAAGVWTLKITASWKDGVSQTVETRIVVQAPPVSTITYTNLKGATNPNPATYEEGTSFTFAAPGAVEGYTFAGWTPSGITADMTGAQTVTANWTKNAAPAGVAELLHRWSFNGDLTDSMGGQTATLGGNVTTDGASYITASGYSGSSYISLGSNVLPRECNEATIEMWVMRTESNNDSWRRIFEMGDVPEGFSFTSGKSYINDVKQETTNSIGMCWTSGGKIRVNAKDWERVDFPTMEANVEYHIAVTYKLNGDRWEVFYYCLDTAGNVIGRYDSSFSNSQWSLAADGRDVFVLGQALTTWDYHEGAKYNEFRIWKKALTEEELVANSLAGPDAVLTSSAPSVVDVGGGKSVAVPQTWLAENTTRAATDTAVNGRKVWECYVLGLDPEDNSATNDFKITSFPMKADGTPDLENIVFEPPEARWNVEGARPVVKGAASLGSEWQAVTEENKAGFRFFKVEVVLP